MGNLSTLPNIGKTVEHQLNEVGILTIEQLINIGSKQAWFRIKAIDDTSCVNKLFALEGAIQGIRWHHLSDVVKKDLKEFYDNSCHTL